MGDKGEGGFKNLKKWVTSFMDGPQVLIFDPSTLLISGGKTATQNHFRDRLTFANFEWSPPQQIFKSDAVARFNAFTFV